MRQSCQKVKSISKQISQAVENSPLKLNKTMSEDFFKDFQEQLKLTDRQISDLQNYLNYFQKFEMSINVENNKKHTKINTKGKTIKDIKNELQKVMDLTDNDFQKFDKWTESIYENACNTAIEDADKTAVGDADKTDLMDNVFKYINKAEDFDQCSGNEKKIKIRMNRSNLNLTCNITVMSSSI